MRKLLLPSIVMVSAYLAIHITALTIQYAKKNKSTNHANPTNEPVAATISLVDKVNKIASKKVEISKDQRFKPFRGNQFKKRNELAVKKDRPLDFSLLPNRVKIPFEHFKTNANKAIALTYQRTGTTIKIPANAFVSQSGDPVTGDIEINYREFVKPSEIFTSGIPMHWQGDEYLESAGMLEIEAWQNGKKLELANKAEIEVAMTSSFTDLNYNLYAFNNDKQNWSYVNNNFSYIDAPSQNQPNTDDWRYISNDSLPEYVMQKMDYTVPVSNVIGFDPNFEDRLKKRESTIYRSASIKLVYEENLFPDLAILGKCEFRILTHKYSELEDLANAVMNKETSLSMGWKDLLIRYPGQKGMVDLNFINDMDTFTLGAEPVTATVGEKKKFLMDYYQYAAVYEKSRKDRLYTKRSKMVKKKVDFEKDTLLVMQLKTQFIAKKVERRFLLDKLIAWNCDRPFPIKPYEPYAVNFISDKVSNISMVYAAIPGKNSVFKAEDFKHFPLVNGGNMYLWVLIDENTVAYITPDMLQDKKWDKINVNDLEMKTMSLDAFLPVLDKEILSSAEKLSAIL